MVSRCSQRRRRRPRRNDGNLARIAWAEVRRHRGRSAVVGLAIVVACVSFVTLTGTSATASVRVREKLTATYRPAYDILVRPPGSFTSFERQAGLVRANYLAGLYGGITLRQFEAIRSVPGVSVAAPIANIGTVLLSARVSLDLGPLLGKESVQVFRVHFGWRSDNGLSRYPGGNAYLVFSRQPFPPALAQRVCSGLGGFAASIPSASSPFSPLLESSLSCATAGHRSDDAGSAPVVSYVFRFPV